MNGKEVVRKLTFDGPSRYTIDCPSEPEDLYIKLEVPSDSGRSAGAGR